VSTGIGSCGCCDAAAVCEEWLRGQLDEAKAALLAQVGTRGWMTEHAATIAKHLVDSGFDPENAARRQVLVVAEEAGEFVGAYRRWTGEARRTGTAEEMWEELADVVISAYEMGDALGGGLDLAIEAKLEKIYTRGWRDAA
jgi:NTP pyrophosphatase (non-canonical NTP hydrolase)